MSIVVITIIIVELFKSIGEVYDFNYYVMATLDISLYISNSNIKLISISELYD